MKYNLFKEKTTQSADLMVNRDRQLQAIPIYYIFYYTICWKKKSVLCADLFSHCWVGTGSHKISQIFKNFANFFNLNQFNNCPIFLPDYFITLFSCFASKTVKQSHNIWWSVCPTVHSPMRRYYKQQIVW